MIGNSWDQYLKEEFKKDYFKQIIEYIKKEYKEKICFPPQNEIFNAFRFTKYEDLKVVILGQDPYHGDNQAEGLSFSVKNTVVRPPSLQNIFKELETDLNIKISNNNSLIPWANEGVLLLNAVLTVERKKPASHQNIGWERFTDEVIKIINKKTTPVVFILWGNYAKNKKKLITNPIHYIIESPHPSPFSAYNGFFGSRPFSKTNEFLISHGIKPINWQI
ncbi:MAG: uracil-DNA glycosylase [Bacilli bacterium]|nr:uracil-DNA glycosylase [Bacilli bacterium]